MLPVGEGRPKRQRGTRSHPNRRRDAHRLLCQLLYDFRFMEALLALTNLGGGDGYSLGLLTLTGSDPMVASSWEKVNCLRFLF